MPAYNAANRIERAIREIEQQNYTDFELIIVNDGSIDDTEKICHSLSDDFGNIKLITQKNMGPGKARETGLDNASGEYIGFVDADDYLHHRALERLIHVLSSTDADIIQFGYTKVDNEGKVLSHNPMVEEKYDTLTASYQFFISQRKGRFHECSK